MTKTQAIIETRLIAPLFRKACEGIGLNPDSDTYTNDDVNRIISYCKDNNIKHTHSASVVSAADGYTISQAAELLGVSKEIFSANYAPKAERIRRGVYSYSSIQRLIEQKAGKSEQPNFEITEVTETANEFKSQPRIQKISVHSNNDGSTMLTIHLENYTEKQLLHKLIELFN